MHERRADVAHRDPGALQCLDFARLGAGHALDGYVTVLGRKCVGKLKAVQNT